MVQWYIVLCCAWKFVQFVATDGPCEYIVQILIYGIFFFLFPNSFKVTQLICDSFNRNVYLLWWCQVKFLVFCVTQDLTYAELSAGSPTQRIPYATATLGRPRTSEFKRHEPTIYAQVNFV